MKCYCSECESIQMQGGGVECKLQGNCTSFTPDPKTNFDRIIESPETLAQEIVNAFVAGLSAESTLKRPEHEDSYDKTLKWLNQEVSK